MPIGIPFTVRRESDAGVEDQIVYLRSRRVGADGSKMVALIREYQSLSMVQVKAAGKAAAMAHRMIEGQSGNAIVDAMEKIDAEQQALMDAAMDASHERTKIATEIVQLALEVNYSPEEVLRIIDALTDAELDAMVSTLQYGQMPKDFFPAPVTRQTPSDTSPSGERRADIFSRPATPELTSSAGA